MNRQYFLVIELIYNYPGSSGNIFYRIIKTPDNKKKKREKHSNEHICAFIYGHTNKILNII